MTSIDIRNVSDVEIDVIFFADNRNKYSDYAYHANRILKGEDNEMAICTHGIDDDDVSCDTDNNATIGSAKDARNLIKALEKAIELGWVS